MVGIAKEYGDPGSYTPFTFLRYSWVSLFCSPHESPCELGLKVASPIRRLEPHFGVVKLYTRDTVGLHGGDFWIILDYTRVGAVAARRGESNRT